MTKKDTKKKKISNPAAELGRMGGNAVVKKYGKEYMKELGKKAAKKRWGKE